MNSNISTLETHMGYWLRFISNHVSSQFQHLIEQEGVSLSEWVTLRLLYGTEGQSHAALTAALGMSKGAVSKIIDRLQSKQLIQVITPESDHRAIHITLTPQGINLVPKLSALADQNDHDFFGHLNKQQHQQLFELLVGIAKHHQLKRVPTK